MIENLFYFYKKKLIVKNSYYILIPSEKFSYLFKIAVINILI